MFKNFKFIIKAQLLKSRSTQLNQGERKKCEAFIETIKNNYSRDKGLYIPAYRQAGFLSCFFGTFLSRKKYIKNK
jgi:hypothetical protein